MTRAVRGFRFLVSAVVLLSFNVALLAAFATAAPEVRPGLLALWLVGDAGLTLAALTLLDR